jgi:hypothetical protein
VCFCRITIARSCFASVDLARSPIFKKLCFRTCALRKARFNSKNPCGPWRRENEKEKARGRKSHSVSRLVPLSIMLFMLFVFHNCFFQGQLQPLVTRMKHFFLVVLTSQCSSNDSALPCVMTVVIFSVMLGGMMALHEERRQYCASACCYLF